jgi:outer membrane protein TolC
MHSSGTSKLFRTAALAVAGLFLISGCKTVGPDFEKPEVPVADTWLDADNEKIDTSEAAYQDWWEVFEDPALSELINTAYRQNLSLQLAGLRVMEARAQLGIANGLK